MEKESFLGKIKKMAMQNKKTIVLPEGEDIRTVTAAHTILKEGLADLIILGDEGKIKELAGSFDISGAAVINPLKSEKHEEFAQLFYEMRKGKGVTLEQARDTMNNPLYFGVMLVKTGIADGMVAGAINSTANVLRPSLQILKTAPGTKLVSAFFVMVVPNCSLGENGTFIFADSGLNEYPDAQSLAEIAISSANSFKMLVGAEPKVAMLSYSSHGSAKSEHVDKVVEATKLAKAAAPKLKLDGELQLDAAIVSEIGKLKAPDSPVAGEANVLIFPNLDAGNIGYKLVQRLANAEAFGPITQGIAKPVNDLSRGCNADDIVGVVAITAVQAGF